MYTPPQRDEVKGSSRFAQHMNKLLSTNTLFSVCPWLDALVSVDVTSERPEDQGAKKYCYTPPLPKISTKPLSTFVQVESRVSTVYFSTLIHCFDHTRDVRLAPNGTNPGLFLIKFQYI